MDSWQLEDRDLDYVVETIAPDPAHHSRLKRCINEDETLRQGMLGSQRVFDRIMGEEALEMRVSSRLFFEVLLRRAREDLEQASHTREKVGAHRLPVFDAPRVVRLLEDARVIDYLARLLVSFMRSQSYTLTVRVRPGMWRRVRLSDMDIHMLQRLSHLVEEPARFDYYRRIGEVSLFVLGIFPDSLAPGDPDPELSPLPRVVQEESAVEYERQGKRHFALAARHRQAQGTDLGDILWTMHENFELAKKPLNYLAFHYLQFERRDLFGLN